MKAKAILPHNSLSKCRWVLSALVILKIIFIFSWPHDGWSAAILSL